MAIMRIVITQFDNYFTLIHEQFQRVCRQI
jgi:hypothetical protein